MPPRLEPLPQRELLLRLRASIDTARMYPTSYNIRSAVVLASQHPQGLRSGHLRANLGMQRWEWLAEQGIYPVGEGTEVAGVPAIKGTITPEVTK